MVTYLGACGDHSSSFSTPLPSTPAQNQGHKQTRQEFACLYVGVVHSSAPPESCPPPALVLRHLLGAPIYQSPDLICLVTRFPSFSGHVAFLSFSDPHWICLSCAI